MIHQAHPHHPPPNRYTYGKPVQGKVQARLCQSFRNTGFPRRLHNSLVNEIKCFEVSGQVSAAGARGCCWDSPSLGLLLTGLTLPPDCEERLLFNRGLVDCLHPGQRCGSE